MLTAPTGENGAGTAIEGLLQDEPGHGRGIVHRIRVGHAGDARVPAGDGGPCTRGDIFLVLLAGFPQMNVHVQQAGDDPFAGGVHFFDPGHPIGRQIESRLHLGDPSVFNQNVTRAVHAPGGIDHAPAAKKKT